VIPPLLRERGFRRYWTGQAISLFGDQITAIALPLAGVLVLHADAAEMGYLGALVYAPNLVFSLWAGSIVDRRGRRRHTMIAADLVRAALLATVPIADAFGELTLAQLYAVAFLGGTLTVFFQVADSALIPALVERERYVEANSLVHGSRAFSFVGGPSVGGALVQLLTAPLALLADAASFLVSAVCLSTIRPAEPPAEEAGRGHVVEGARFIWRTPTLRAALGATAVINFFNFVFFALFILYATRSLGIRAGTLGLILGAGAVGGLIGAVLTGRIGRRIGIGPAFRSQRTRVRSCSRCSSWRSSAPASAS
jgi:MFS family permease